MLATRAADRKRRFEAFVATIRPDILEVMDENAKRMMFEMYEDSDRAAALMGGAHLDTLLGRLLEASLVDERETSQIMSGDREPLGAFSARIKMCRALALISGPVAEDLDRLKTVRNHFAHEEAASFEDDKIRSALNGDPKAKKRPVRLPLGFQDAALRTKFTYAVTGLAGFLTMRLRSAQRPMMPAPDQNPDGSWVAGILGREE